MSINKRIKKKAERATVIIPDENFSSPPITTLKAEYCMNCSIPAQLQKAKDLIHHADNKHAELQEELVIAKKCNSCMSRQLTEPLSCNGSEDGTCDQDWRDKGRIAELEAELAKYEWVSVEDRLPPKFYLEVEVYNASARLILHASMKEDMKFYAREDQGFIASVTHWKPITLPSPTIKPEPKKESE